MAKREAKGRREEKEREEEEEEEGNGATQTVDNIVSRGRFPWRFPNERIENEDTKESASMTMPRRSRDDRFS